MLEEIESAKQFTLVSSYSVPEAVLTIHLVPNILNDNESIDNTLYNRIVKFIVHFDKVKNILIFIDS